MENYFGTYVRFDSPEKSEVGKLLSADNIVGDVYDIRCNLEDGKHVAWLVNRFDQRPGLFDVDFSRRISILQAKGLTCKAILSFVAFTDHPDEGHYWGEVAVVCYSPNYASVFDTFISNVSARLSDGVRTKVDLDAEDVRRLIDSNGEWIPKQTVPMPDKSKGMAIIKNRRKLSDKLIEQGRRGNKGCYFVSWAFLIALAVAVIFGIKACAGL